MPGESTFSDVMRAFEQIGVIRSGLITIQLNEPMELQLTLETNYRDSIVVALETYNYEGVADWYILPAIIKTYGSPEEVALYTVQVEEFGSRPTGIILFYGSRGFMIEYVAFDRLEVIGDFVELCPRWTYNFLYSWPPEYSLSFDQAISDFIQPSYSAGIPQPKRLEEATGLDAAEFIQLFAEGAPPVPCIQTPLAIWPEY
jgi:hypothetical protein